MRVPWLLSGLAVALPATPQVSGASQAAEPPRRGWNVRGLQLPAETLKKICHDNAAKLLSRY